MDQISLHTTQLVLAGDSLIYDLLQVDADSQPMNLQQALELVKQRLNGAAQPVRSSVQNAETTPQN